MKKVSVQFNLSVPDNTTHKELAETIKKDWQGCKITSIQINNIEQKRGRDDDTI